MAFQKLFQSLTQTYHFLEDIFYSTTAGTDESQRSYNEQNGDEKTMSCQNKTRPNKKEHKHFKYGSTQNVQRIQRTCLLNRHAAVSRRIRRQMKYDGNGKEKQPIIIFFSRPSSCVFARLLLGTEPGPSINEVKNTYTFLQLNTA